MFKLDPKLILVATALAGALGNSSQGPIWRNLCLSLSSQMKGTYLRILFGLLATEGDWVSVLSGVDLPLLEGMAVALRFLDNHDLFDYVTKWTKKVVSHGRLDGLLLTGWSESGMDLLEHYLERTGDLQSVALLSCIKPSLAQNYQRTGAWTERYD